MAKSKKTTVKSTAAGKQQQQLEERLKTATQKIAALKKEFQVKLDAEKATAFNKGYTQAMQQVSKTAKAKTKDMLSLAQNFEKEFAKLTAVKVAKKASSAKKVKKSKVATKKPVRKADAVKNDASEQA